MNYASLSAHDFSLSARWHETSNYEVVNFDQFPKPKHNQQHVGREWVADLLKSILPFSMPPERYVFVGEDLQSL